MKSKQEEFIEMVLTCADEIGTTTDNSTLITFMLYKIDVLYKLLYK
jgi:hypothetical protein